MKNPVISVVMVACNVERFLAEAIESVLRQTFTDFEFIVVDFGSTDNSKSIISSYAAKDSRLKFHEIPHCGLAEARNASCSLAQGEYIAVMDADDISLPNRLLAEVDFMEQHPEVGVVGGATEWIDATGKGWGIHDCPTEDREIKSAFAVYHPFFHPTLLIRKQAFALVGGYRSAFAPAEDYDLTMRMSEHYGCANLKQVVLQYRIHAYQLSQQKRRQQTMGKLAAQACAFARKDGNPDPMDAIAEITPEMLGRLGVTYATQQRELALDRYQWIRNMCAVGKYSWALDAALELLQSDLEHVERWLIADLRLLAARLYWKQGKFATSCTTAAYAFMTRPVMIARPAKSLLRSLESLNRRQPISARKG
jgi:glycosyltransferase involved in cell wall biosynthesis